MIRPAFLLFALAGSAVISACSDPTAFEPQHALTAGSTDLFLVAGQSNGRGPYGLSNYTTLVNALGTATAWPTFAVEYHRRTGREVAIVNAVRGGTSLTFRSDDSRAPGYVRGSWDRRGPHFDVSVEMLASALMAHPVYTLRGLIWIQGEADAAAIDRGIISGALYERTLLDLVARYRSKYGVELPVYVVRTGKLKECSAAYPSVTCADGETKGFKAVRAAQDRAVSRLPRTMIWRGTVNFPRTNMMANLLHYNLEGYQMVGRNIARLAAEYIGPFLTAFYFV
jgi:hypothetical protein